MEARTLAGRYPCLPTWTPSPVVSPVPGVGVVAGAVVGPMTTIPYSVAYSYVLALLTGQARLRETKALTSTAILEARKHGRIDSTVVFPPPRSLTRGEAEVWMRAIGTAA
jgi:hypothetical protein